MKPRNDVEKAVRKDFGADGKLAYEAPYFTFTISPSSAKRAATASRLLEEDDELRAWFAAAAARDAYILGIVV